MHRTAAWILIVLVCAGCGDTPRLGGDQGVACTSNADCTNDRFCDGEERCDPLNAIADARGCVAGVAPCSALLCNETQAECMPDCDNPDADRDGHRAVACGGDDCDDDDPNRFPGNVEVCSVDDHDEDCDFNTFGVRDQDRDDFPDAACCNRDETGTLHCGSDCDDTIARIHPTQQEVCDGLDNDCSGGADDGLQFFEFYPDCDRDDHGDATAEPTQFCMIPTGAPPSCPLGQYALTHDDCDDTRAAVAPGLADICDGLDNDCVGGPDTGLTFVNYYPDCDRDGFGDENATPVSACAVPTTPPSVCVGGTYSSNGTDCDDGSAVRYPMAPELCDTLDNDCDSSMDENVVIAAWFVDMDGDGFGDPNTAPVMNCNPVSGRVTNTTDCDDGDANTYFGAPEVCDRRFNNCSSSAVNTAEDVDNDGHAGLSAPCFGGPLPRDDCDDDDPDTHPSAAELCDNLDNDCSVGGGTVVEDADGDGFAPATVLCTVPAARDCDDTRATIYPGAPEVCDGFVSNCSANNGGSPNTEDSDGDGFANPAHGCISTPDMPATDCFPTNGSRATCRNSVTVAEDVRDFDLIRGGTELGIAVIDFYTDAVGWYDESGTYTEILGEPACGGGLKSIRTFDFSGDGLDDIVADRCDGPHWLRNPGTTGAWTELTDPYTLNDEPALWAACDLGGSVAFEAIERDKVIRVSGLSVTSANLLAPSLRYALDCEDVDMDGQNEVVRVRSSTAQGTEAVQVCDGGSPTTAFTCTTVGMVDNGYDRLFAVNVDNDGDLDIIVPAGASAAQLLTNHGSTWSHAPLPFTIGNQCWVGEDLNGDGYADLAYYSFPDYLIRSRRPDGSWFSDQFAGGNGCGYRSAAYDFDHDGDKDLFVLGCNNDVLRYTLSGGVFGPP